MNTLFTLKNSLILLLLLVCQLNLKASAAIIKKLDTTVTTTDTTAAKKANSSVKITSDTTLYIRTGSTIVVKSDTTMVINTDNKGQKALYNSPQNGTGQSTVPGSVAPADAGPSVGGTNATPGAAAVVPALNTTDAGKAANDTQAKSGNPVTLNVSGTNTKKDSSLNTKTDSIKAKTDTALNTKKDSLTAKTDTLNNDSLSSMEKRAKIAFLEIGGPGLAISANYDVRFSKKNTGWGIRIGVGGFVSGGNNVITIPLQFNYLYGEGDHLLELGAGTTFLHSRGDNKGHFWQFDNITGFIGTGTIGYRYQPVGGRINLRIAFVPIIYDEGLIPIGGISVGYSF